MSSSDYDALCKVTLERDRLRDELAMAKAICRKLPGPASGDTVTGVRLTDEEMAYIDSLLPAEP